MSAGHDHPHDHTHASGRRLGLTLTLVVGYMVAEVVGGLLSGSLALLADAGHMASDSAALVLALFAHRISRRPATRTHTFGYRRAEILAALANGAALIAIAAVIAYEAVGRMGAPPQVRGTLMLAVASGGLVVNLLSLWILHGGRNANLNVRGAWLHVIADALGSVGAIVAALAIEYLGWTWADPVASLAISTLVVYSAWRLLRQTVGVLMQAVPSHVDLEALEHALTGVDGVVAVHDLHVWSVTSGRDVMSAHLSLAEGAERDRVAELVHKRLHDDFNLDHTTIQLECPKGCRPCA